MFNGIIAGRFSTTVMDCICNINSMLYLVKKILPFRQNAIEKQFTVTGIQNISESSCNCQEVFHIVG